MIDLYKGEYLIDAIDILSFRPLVQEQAVLELLKMNYPCLPIDGNFILKLKEGFTIKCTPCPAKLAFIYTFHYSEDTVVENGLIDG